MTISTRPDNIAALKIKPLIIPRDQHPLSRSLISDNALKVLYRLKNAGYKAYLVGGGVRDILLGRAPKDFDVVTDARPEQIRELFRNCRLIGRRFRLAHIRFGAEIIEVSTFRAPHHVSDQGAGHSKDGRIIRDNVYGDIDDDVWRRDFTVNALFYNIADFSIVDYVGGVRDLKAGQLKLIGDPARRYTEDPVRILRAVRFAAKLGLRIHPEAEAPFNTYAGLLRDIPAARLFEETLKLLTGGQALRAFELLRHYDLFQYLFPETDQLLNGRTEDRPLRLITQALKNTDQRLREGHSIAPGFLLAVLLWEAARTRINAQLAKGLPEMEAVRLAGDAVISRQVSSTAAPRRFTYMMRDIWALQSRLKRIAKQPLRVLSHPRFRAAYDLLLLRAEAGEPVQEFVDYWTEAQLKAPLTSRHKAKSEAYKTRARRGPRRRKKDARNDP